ncbi:MAG: cytochrome c oxidase subunit II [Mesorhizobium sp.]
MRRVASLFLFTVALSGCSGSPLGYLDATSPIAGAIARLGLGLTAISIGVCIVVGVLLVVALWRGRRADDLAITPVNDRAAIRWIGFGVAISTVFLVGSAVWTLLTVSSIGQPAQASALSIDVIGQEWWWAVKYRSSNRAREFVTANQLVIPVGVPVQINLTSKDVIHSFWVPKLGGKMDMIPSRTNVTWLQADKVGDFRGQCSEFCGLQHANMAFNVRVLSKPDFEAWWDRQLLPTAGSGDDPRLKTFLVRCAACHTIRGTPAGGILGPDLSHFGDRETIASGLMTNTPANLAKWINNTQTIKPGVKMPELHMLASEIDDVTTYLEGLK